MPLADDSTAVCEKRLHAGCISQLEQKRLGDMGEGVVKEQRKVAM